MNDRILLGPTVFTLIVGCGSLTQTFLQTVSVTDQNRHVNQLASQVGDLAGVVSSRPIAPSVYETPLPFLARGRTSV